MRQVSAQIRFLSRAQLSLFPTLLILGLTGLIRAESILNFPRLSLDSATIMGIAIVNPNDVAALVRLTAYDSQGRVIFRPGIRNPVDIVVPAGLQYGEVTAAIFGTGLDPQTEVWLQAVSGSDDLTGFFLFLDPQLSFFDGADLPVASEQIVFIDVRLEEGFSTEINVLNPNPAIASVELRLMSQSVNLEKEVEISPRGVLRLDVLDFFGATATPESFFVQATSNQLISGLALVRGTGDLLGFNAQPAQLQLDTLFFPQLAVLDPFKTQLTLVNLSFQTELVTITAYQPDGSLFGADHVQVNPVTLVLKGREVVGLDLEELFGFSGPKTLEGWLRAESTSQAFQGSLSYSIPVLGSRATVSSSPAGSSNAVFSHIATTGGFFTGVALLNSGALTANVRITTVGADGGLLGIFTTILQPRQRISNLIEELIPQALDQGGGFIRIRSDVPLFLTSLFGNTASGVLANIPAQPVPSLFRPDAAAPTFRLTPPLAVVAPGGSLNFTLQGGSNAKEWRVNGVQGGNEILGTISAAGTYLAPSSFSSALPITISASVEDQTVGASVDILSPMQLFSGLGIVQSLAFLSGIEKLFTAELVVQEAKAQLKLGQAVSTGIFDVTSGDHQNVIIYPGEDIQEIVPFEGNDGNEYLLLAGNTTGQILRLNPLTEQSQAVAIGLSAPVAAVVDPLTGNLIVAEANRIVTIPSSALNLGLGPAKSQQDLPLGIFAENVSASGITVNRCDGAIYISLKDTGRIQTIDRLTQSRTTVLSGLIQPRAMLAVYRKDVPCPKAFLLIVLEEGAGRISLIDTLLRTRIPMIPAAGVSDLVLRSSTASSELSNQRLLFSAVEGNIGSILQLSLPALYEPRPINSPRLGSLDPGQIQFSSTVYTTPENRAQRLITVTRSSGNAGAASVDYATSNLAARAGADYSAVSGTLNWADGEDGVKAFGVPILDDNLVEGNENLRLTLTNATGAALGSPRRALLVIEDVEPGILQFTSLNFVTQENAGMVAIAVRRSQGNSGPASVDYATSNFTAEAGSDYSQVSGTLRWSDGEGGTKTFQIPILDDQILESNETVNLLLGNVVGAALGLRDDAVLTIEDVEPGQLQFSSAAYSIGETGPRITIAVTRTGGSSGPASANYRSLGVTAKAGQDYVAVSGILTWADGDSTPKIFDVQIIDDGQSEANETLDLILFMISGANPGTPTVALLTIMDNDIII